MCIKLPGEIPRNKEARCYCSKKKLKFSEENIILQCIEKDFVIQFYENSDVLG